MSLTADGSGASHSSRLRTQTVAATDQKVLHVLVLLLLTRLCLRCQGDRGGAVLLYRPRKLLSLVEKEEEEEEGEEEKEERRERT